MNLQMKELINMSIMNEIHLNRFKPRDYQLAACDAFENIGYRKMLLVWPRRAGKIFAFTI
jgi:hypothetical protein